MDLIALFHSPLRRCCVSVSVSVSEHEISVHFYGHPLSSFLTPLVSVSLSEIALGIVEILSIRKTPL